MKRLTLFFLVLFFSTISVSRAFIVTEIRVEGLQRISTNTVYNQLKVNVGSDIGNEEVANIIRSVFSTGYFNDVSVNRDDDILIIKVLEKPVINKIEISGNKLLSQEQLLKELRLNYISEGDIYQNMTLDNIRMNIEKSYHEQGRYTALVTLEVDELPKNRVNIRLKIREGKIAKINKINIIGANAFKKEELLKLLTVYETKGNILSYFESQDEYSQPKLNHELNVLKSFYFDRGYVEFAVNSTQVSISPDKSGVYITINISEGPNYKVNSVKLSGEIVEKKELQALLKIKPNDIYSESLVQETEIYLMRALRSKGYPFSRVNIVRSMVDNNKLDVEFYISLGQQVYVRKINFFGNFVTQDEVLRREMRQMESALVNDENIQRSIYRLQSLGFFKYVDLKKIPVANTYDQIDLNIFVLEQYSGSLNFRLGYTGASSFEYGIAMSKQNFLGTGNMVGITLDKSRSKSYYSFNYVNPYFTKHGVSQSIDLYLNSLNTNSSVISDYNIDSRGGQMGLSYPISESQSINFGLGFESMELSYGLLAPGYMKKYKEKEGSQYKNLVSTLSWNQSTLNHPFLPTKGQSQGLQIRFSIPGSKLNFYQASYKAQYFQSLFDWLTLRLSTSLGYLDTYKDGEYVPYFKHFHAGGIGTVRGYVDDTLGAKLLRSNHGQSYIGGNIKILANAELIFPFPFVKDKSKFRSVFFIDSGNVFNNNCDSDMYINSDEKVLYCKKPALDEIRFSAGVGVTWLTPIGAFSFSWAKALNSKKHDQTEKFQFTIGTSF